MFWSDILIDCVEFFDKHKKEITIIHLKTMKVFLKDTKNIGQLLANLTGLNE